MAAGVSAMMSQGLRRGVVAACAALLAVGVCAAETLTLSLLAPFCVGTEATCGWPGGPSQNQSAYLMAELMNEAQLLGPARQVRIAEEDTACSPEKGLERSFNLMMRRPEDRPFAIVGCGCSGASIMATQVAHQGLLPLVSGASTSQLLSSRSKYPGFFRTVAPDGPIITVWFSTFYALGWKDFAHFYDMEWGHFMLETYEQNLEHFGGEMVDVLKGTELAIMHGNTQQDARVLLNQIVRTKVRGVMANVYESKLRHLTCQMSKRGVTGMVIAHLGWFSPVWWTVAGGGIDCSVESMDAQSEYFISSAALMWDAKTDAKLTCSPAKTVSWFRGEYLRRLHAHGLVDWGYASNLADAICMLVLLFRAMRGDGYESKELHGMNKTTYAQALRTMQALEFQGALGWVSFPEDPTQYAAGDVAQTFEVNQKVGGAYAAVGLMRLRNFRRYPSKTLVFAGGKSLEDPPTALFPSCTYGEYDFLSESCISCPTHFLYNNATESCGLWCPPGLVPNSAADGCDKCPTGRAKTEFGFALCAACLPGYFSATEGATECAWCPLGRFANKSGSDECRLCGDGGLLTTLEVGSANSTQCVCTEGTFLAEAPGAGCRPCPAGMACPAGSDERSFLDARHGPAPEVLEGYMTLRTDPLTVYKCVKAGQCPGGPPGRCAALRDPRAVACGYCEYGAHDAGEECQPCKGSSGALFILVVLAALVMLAGTTYLVNRDMVKQTHANLRVVVLMGLTLTSVQTLGAFHALTLQWFSPLAELIEYMTLLSFNIKVLSVGCVVDAGAVKMYLLRQCVAPVSLLVLFVMIVCKKRFVSGQASLRTEFVNTAAFVFNICFISIITSGLAPLVCYGHPGENRSSVLTEPSILCFNSKAHSMMLAIGIVAMLTVPVPFISVTCWATMVFPAHVNARDMVFVASFQSVFFRFRPERYYYAVVLICRSLSICLVPVVFRSDTALQVFMMCAVVEFFDKIQQSMTPWTSPSTNEMDSVASKMMVLLLVAGALGSPVPLTTSVIRLLGTATFLLLFALVVILITVAAYRRLKPKPFYDCLVCHHKRDAAGQARFVKDYLSEMAKLNVFIDSDNLFDLGTLFDTVKWRVRRLVVYLTRDTLRRPWCAGEITTAFTASSATVAAVITPSFQAPEAAQLEDLTEFLEDRDSMLAKYCITHEHVSESYQLLLHPSTPRIEINPELLGTARLDHMVHALASGAAPREAQPEETLELPVSPGMLTISCEPDNDEAIAAASTLLLRTSQAVCTQITAGICIVANYQPDLDRIATLVARSRSVIVFLSSGTLTSPDQLIVIDELMAPQFSPVGGILSVPAPLLSLATSSPSAGAKPGPTFVPVNLPGFDFPTPAVWVAMPPALEEVLSPFFSLISAPFTLSASDDVLSIQARSIIHRARLGQQPMVAASFQTQPASGRHRLPELDRRRLTEIHSIHSTRSFRSDRAGRRSTTEVARRSTEEIRSFSTGHTSSIVTLKSEVQDIRSITHSHSSGFAAKRSEAQLPRAESHSIHSSRGSRPSSALSAVHWSEDIRAFSPHKSEVEPIAEQEQEGDADTHSFAAADPADNSAERDIYVNSKQELKVQL